jgi:hypothetical protein
MYIPYQFVIAIENDRLRAAGRRQLLVDDCCDCAACLARADERSLKSLRSLGRRLARAFGRRPAVGAVA